MFYENARAACQRKGTTLTAVLQEIGRSTGSTGAWKSGVSPKLEVVMEISDHLNISIDELVYGEGHIKKWIPNPNTPNLTSDQEEWLSIVDGIPEDKREICKDFLRTHMVVPEKHLEGKMA